MFAIIQCRIFCLPGTNLLSSRDQSFVFQGPIFCLPGADLLSSRDRSFVFQGPITRVRLCRSQWGKNMGEGVWEYGAVENIWAWEGWGWEGAEKTKYCGALWSVIVTKYFADDQIEKNEMGVTSRTYGGEKKCIHLIFKDPRIVVWFSRNSQQDATL